MVFGMDYANEKYQKRQRDLALLRSVAMVAGETPQPPSIPNQLYIFISHFANHYTICTGSIIPVTSWGLVNNLFFYDPSIVKPSYGDAG
jgi:hypothetical protein